MRLTEALKDVVAERERQRYGEGFDAARDDKYTDGQMAKVAGCYALASASNYTGKFPDTFVVWGWAWPRDWATSWWKPTSRRRDLVKAGALILAEIERLDRAARRRVYDEGCT